MVIDKMKGAVDKLKKSISFVKNKPAYKPNIPKSFRMLLDLLYSNKKMVGDVLNTKVVDNVVKVYWDPVVDYVSKETNIDKKTIKEVLEPLREKFAIKFIELLDYYSKWNDAVIKQDVEAQKEYAIKVENVYKDLVSMQDNLKDEGVNIVKSKLQ